MEPASQRPPSLKRIEAAPALQECLLGQILRHLRLPGEIEQIAIDGAVVLADKAVTRLDIPGADLLQETGIRVRRQRLRRRSSAQARFHVQSPLIHFNGDATWRLRFLFSISQVEAKAGF